MKELPLELEVSPIVSGTAERSSNLLRRRIMGAHSNFSLILQGFVIAVIQIQIVRY